MGNFLNLNPNQRGLTQGQKILTRPSLGSGVIQKHTVLDEDLF